MARTQWHLAERGIAGPGIFIPWQQASAYEWTASNALVITTPASLAIPHRLTIPVRSGNRDRTDEILAAHIPSR